MYVLGIGGSPRRKGLSDSLLDEALDGARSEGCHIEKIVLSELKIRPCDDCGGCGEKGTCVIEDDMAKVRPEIEQADGIIIASPIYFASVTAQLKAMIDRYQDAWISRYILKRVPFNRKARKGAFLCVSGEDKPQYFENAKQVVKAFFATLGIEYSGELFLGNANSYSRFSSNKDEALKKAFELGSSLAKNL